MNHFLELNYHMTGRDIRSFLPHNDYAVEILQTWSDGGHFLIKDHIFPIQTSGIYIIDAMDTHCSKPADINTYSRNKIIVAQDYFLKVAEAAGLQEQAAHMLKNGGQCFLPVSSSEKALYKIDRLFQKAYNLFLDEAPYLETKLCHILIEILLILLEEVPPYNVLEPAKNNQTEYLLNMITSYINDTHSYELSLDKMCSDLHMSKSSICHLFKKHTDIPVMQYANNLRMSQAKKLLTTTNLKTYEIAAMLGFSSSTVFCKTFKKYTGIPPQKYRNDGYHLSEPRLTQIE